MSRLHLGFLAALGVGWCAPVGTACAAEPEKLDLEAESDADLFFIQGRVQRPEVTVVIRRDNLDRGFKLEIKESFLDRIPDALRRPPF